MIRRKPSAKKEVEDGSFEAAAVLKHVLQHWRDSDVVRRMGREVCLEKLKSLMTEAGVEVEDVEEPEEVKKKADKKKRKMTRRSYRFCFRGEEEGGR